MTAYDASVGDVAVPIVFTARVAGIAADLTGATLTALVARKPSGARTSYASSTLTVVSAAAGTYRWTAASGAITEPGEWSFQLRTTEGGVTMHYDSETKLFGTKF